MMEPDQARQFLVQSVAMQAERERSPLSRAELQLLLIPEAEPPVDSAVIEAKLASLIARTSRNVDSYQWHEAVELLETEGTYLSLLLISSRHVVDWTRLRRTLITAVIGIVAIYYFTKYTSRWI